MPNTFLTPDIIAREALMVLRNNAVMAGLVYRDYSSEFNGAVGDVITIRKPAKFVSKEFTDTITVQDATENSVQVKMDKHIDVSFAVTAKQLSLDIKSFSEQLLVPAMQVFNDTIDNYIIGDMVKNVAPGMVVDHTAGTPIGASDIVDVREKLVDKAVPNSNRYFVCGAKNEADLLKTDLFVSAEKVGDNGTALRDASIGRKFGLDFYTDQNVKQQTGSPNYNPSFAFHRNAYALVTRQLAQPLGASKSAYVDYDGFGLRVVMDYDIEHKKDIVSIDMLCGIKQLDKDMLAILKDKTA